MNIRDPVIQVDVSHRGDDHRDDKQVPSFNKRSRRTGPSNLPCPWSSRPRVTGSTLLRLKPGFKNKVRFETFMMEGWDVEGDKGIYFFSITDIHDIPEFLTNNP